MLKVSDLFENKRMQWGLRGDPYLWDALQGWFEGKGWPDSAENFHLQLNAAFAEITGHSIQAETHFQIEQFSHGGMSSGMISPQFWRERGIPVLLKSYRIAQWHEEHALEKMEN